MEQCWRWFGPEDVITLPMIRQTGATGIVTALHQIPYGEIWSIDEIDKRKATITADPALGLRWSVVESLPIHERIKLGDGDLTGLFDNYRQSMRNLGHRGLNVICYNFMPVLDWTRTQLAAPLPGGGTALRFEASEFAAFDCYMLERQGAEADYTPATLVKAREWFDCSRQVDRDRLLATIMAGLPGAFERFDIPGLRKALNAYRGITRDTLRENLARFLREIIPVAEECNIKMCIHPDDPPRPLMGLPRIVSNEADIAYILSAVPSTMNGLTLCSGSLGAHPDNDIIAIARRFADRIYFAHLRNVKKEFDGSFQEAAHLAGDTDMVALVVTLLQEQHRRKNAGLADWRIPLRPDHGHELLDDVGKKTHPGYPVIGRLRGLAELRGVMTAAASFYKLSL